VVGPGTVLVLGLDLDGFLVIDQLVSEPVTDLRDSNQSKIQRWHTSNRVWVHHTLMVRTTRCGKGGWLLSSVARVRSCGMSR
jgi:hypothetical protein